MKLRTTLMTLAALALAVGAARAERLAITEPGGGGLPSEVTAGFAEVSVDTGEDAVVMLLRLHEGTDEAELEAAMAGVNAALLTETGFAATVGDLFEVADLLMEVHPDGSAVGAELEPGRYAVEYAVWPEEGEPESVDYAYFDVVDGRGDPAPAAAATVTMRDFAFEFPADLRAGRRTLRVVNEGEQLHHMVLIRLADGKTLDDLIAWMETEDGPPPGEEVGMVGVFGPGETVYRAFDLTPGDYVAVCFIPDYLGDGAPHLMHGMIQAFTVGE